MLFALWSVRNYHLYYSETRSYWMKAIDPTKCRYTGVLTHALTIWSVDLKTFKSLAFGSWPKNLSRVYLSGKLFKLSVFQLRPKLSQWPNGREENSCKSQWELKKTQLFSLNAGKRELPSRNWFLFNWLIDRSIDWLSDWSVERVYGASFLDQSQSEEKQKIALKIVLFCVGCYAGSPIEREVSC